jgi:hypothetical protein
MQGENVCVGWGDEIARVMLHVQHFYFHQMRVRTRTGREVDMRWRGK